MTLDLTEAISDREYVENCQFEEPSQRHQIIAQYAKRIFTGSYSSHSHVGSFVFGKRGFGDIEAQL